MIVEPSEAEVSAIALGLDGIASESVMLGESDFALKPGQVLIELDGPVAVETFAIAVESLAIGILVATASDFD